MYEDFEGATSYGNYGNYYAWDYVNAYSGCYNGTDSIDMDTIDSPGSMHSDGGSNAWHLQITNDLVYDCWKRMPADTPAGTDADHADQGAEGYFGLYNTAALGGAPGNYACAQSLTFWYYSDTAISANAYWQERTPCATPNDKEDWNFPAGVSFVGDSAWHKVTLSMSSVVMSGSSFCDGVPDASKVGGIWFYITSSCAGANLWVDHFRFEN